MSWGSLEMINLVMMALNLGFYAWGSQPWNLAAGIGCGVVCVLCAVREK